MSKETGDFNPICLGLHFAGVNPVHYNYLQTNGKTPTTAVCTFLVYMYMHINVYTHTRLVHAYAKYC